MQNKKCTDDENIHMHFNQLINMCKQPALMGKSMVDHQFATGVAMLTTPILQSHLWADHNSGWHHQQHDYIVFGPAIGDQWIWHTC